MKILIILPNDNLGGAEQCLKMIAKYYRYEEVSIFFLNSYNTKSWVDLENTTNQYFCSKTNRFFGVLKLIQILIVQRVEYDCAFTSHISINALVGILISFKIIKTKKFVVRESTSIYTRYDGLKLFFYKLLYKIGYRNIDLLICQTDFMKYQLIENFKNIEKRALVKTIPNPIDIDFLTTQRQKENSLYLDYKFIVTAGRLIYEKGFDILINAFSHIKLINPNVKLLILGDGPLKSKLQEQIESLNLVNQVILVGHVRNVYDYFKLAELCVVSSIIEGFPNVLLQMMSQNDNVVSTTCAGDIDKIPGIVTCEPNNVSELKLAIETGLANNNNNRERFDTYLKARSINEFMKTVNLALQ
jgi:glycosyltransferase involved in cell wall biosynthesis